MITLEEARLAVKEIASIKHDDEIAHSREDALHTAVLETIASKELFLGIGYAQALAREALKTEDIDFSRWYA